MIPVWFVLQWFWRMLKERWAYDWSGAEYGKVSCAGAWVFIFKQWGLKISHGSNTIWRKHTGRKGKLSEFTLKPGDAVFKWRKDGEPAQYEQDGEDDFYHMGCFVGPTEKYPEGAVIEAKGTNYGVVMTSINDGWSHGAEMLNVDYALVTEPEQQNTAIVKAGNGKPVNMRAGASTKHEIIEKVQPGERVTVLEVVDGWAQVQHGGKSGWMFETFLEMEFVPGVPGGGTDTGDAHIVTVSVPELEHLLAMIEETQVSVYQKFEQLMEIVQAWNGVYRT